MWRSLFYAVGIGLFSLGLQGLVVEHVLVPKDTKLQKLVRKILDDDSPKRQNNVAVLPVGNVGSNPQQNYAWGSQPRQAAAPAPTRQSFGANTGSRFGPSRFSGPAYGTGYGGGRVASAPQNGAGFGGFQNQNQGNAQLAGYRTSGTTTRPAAQKPIALQKFLVREWMPWSLLASGAIIFLYTHTLHRRRIDD